MDTLATKELSYSANLSFSAPPLRSLRLGGERISTYTQRRDAEVAETRREELKSGHYEN